MGKKKDELKLELVRVQNDTEALRLENQRLRQAVAEAASDPYRDAPYRPRLVTDPKETTTRVKIAKALGIEIDDERALTDEAVLEAVERLRGPTLHSDEGHVAVVGKDSLAEAIMHNKHQRDELLAGVSKSRDIIGRVAGALGVGQWNADGDELVEKAQRFGAFRYWLRKRLHDAEAGIERTDLHAEAIAGELRTILAALVAEKELAKLLQNKPVKASKTVLDLAENRAPSGNTYLDVPFTNLDIGIIHIAVEGWRRTTEGNNKRLDQIIFVLLHLTKPSAAQDEFLQWINLIVLPALRKEHPAYQTVPKER